MIKLVASDMDGTLLPDNKVLDREIFDIIRRMKAAGVRFVAASGRQYQSLRRLFAPVAEDIYFIADNGAQVIYREKEISAHPMDRALVKEILPDLLSYGDHPIMLGGKKSAYCNTERQYKYLSSPSFRFKVALLKDLWEADDDILKISFIDGKDPYRTLSELQQRFGQRCNVTFSGYDCIDFMEKGVDKGMALSALQNYLGISPEETLVFGDNLNDLEMMACAVESFAMVHSPDGVKQAAAHVLGSNNEGAVIHELRRRFPET